MEYNLCLDEDTLDFNGDGEAELVFDSEFFDLTSEGLAFKNNLAYRREFSSADPTNLETPLLLVDSTPITMGASLLTGGVSKCRFNSPYINHYGDPTLYDFYLNFFDWELVLGSGFSLGSGGFSWQSTGYWQMTPDSDWGWFLECPQAGTGGTYSIGTGFVGNIFFEDVSTPANNRTYILQSWGVSIQAWDFTGGTLIGTSDLFTFAVGDKIRVSGWSISPALRDRPLI